MGYFQGASGALIASGSIIDLVIPFNCQVKRATLLGDVDGSAIIEVLTDTYANFPPTGADRISGPGMRMATSKAQDSGLASWSNTFLDVGNVLRFSVSGATTSINRVSVILEVLKEN